MPSEGVDIRVRTTGARNAARDVDRVGASTGRLGSHARRTTGDLRLFSRATSSATGGLRIMGGAALYGGAAIGGLLFVGIKKATDAFEEKRKIVAQTGAVLKSTGGLAGVTAGDVDRLSNSLSRVTGIDDEVVRDTENLLLTFRDIRNRSGAGNDIFTQSTKTALDLAAAMHMGPRQAALQLGKALNDPERGFKRLQRIGVAFTDQQEQQIINYSAQGERVKAQQVILAELNKEFGGSAAKQATSLDRLKVSWGNIEEAIGKGVSPAVDSLAKQVDHFFVQAEPQILAFDDRMGKLFKRKDLSLEQKLDLAGADLSRTTRPLRRAIERELGHLDIGDKLADAFDEAAPRIADAAGRAAPRAAGAFVKAFVHAGPYGQLFTVGLLASKLGAFGALGRLAVGRFKHSWSRNLGTLPAPVPTPIPTGGGPGGKGGGGAAGTGGLLSGGLLARGKSLLASGARALGVIGAGITADQLLKQTPLGRYSGDDDGWGNLGKDLGLGGGNHGSTMIKPLLVPNVLPDPRNTRPAPRGRGRARVRAGAGNATTIVLHTTATMPLTAEGGKLVARSINRVNADAAARKGG